MSRRSRRLQCRRLRRFRRHDSHRGVTHPRTIGVVISERMPAAVYVGDGEIAVRELDVPDARRRRGARRGLALRDLRHRPAPRARAVRPARQRARPRVGRNDRGGRPRRAGLGGRRARRAEPDARVRRVPGVPARPAVGVPAPRAARSPRLHARRVLPLQGRARSRGCCAFPRRCRRARPRSPSRPRSRSTP